MWNKVISSLQNRLGSTHFLNSPKNIRFLGLIIISFIAFSNAIFYSVYVLFTNDYIQYNTSRKFLSNFNSIVEQVTVLFLLVYILHLQGRKLSNLGFSFQRKDFSRSFVLLIKSYFFQILLLIFISIIYSVITSESPKYFMQNLSDPRSRDFIRGGITLMSLLRMVVNPFLEELIVRAYLMTEVEYLSGSINLAIILSVLIQASYHYYQGAIAPLVISVGFTIFAFSYAKTRRIMPIILAHMYGDLIALVLNNIR